MQSAPELAQSRATLVKWLPRRVVGAVLWSLTASASAAYLGDPFVPDPSATISGADTAGSVWIGISSPASTLTIQGGGSLNLDPDKSFYVGVDLGANIATVTGVGSASQASLAVPNDIYVGLNDASDNNTMTVGDWGNVTANRLVIGMNDNSSSNIFTASGANGLLQITGDVYVGYNGDNNQAIINLGRDISVGGHVYLGVEAASSGNILTVTGSGTTLVSAQEMIIGFGGNANTLQVQNGGQVTNRHTYMGFSSGADNNGAAVTGPGSVWRTNGVFYFGFASDNNQVTVNTDGQVIVGTGSGVQNRFTVTPDGAVRIAAGRIATITGDYLQQTGGTLHLDVSSPSSYGQLVVTGNATLSNAAQMTVTATDCAGLPVGTTLLSVLAAASLDRAGINVSDNCPTVDFQAVQRGNEIDLQAIAPPRPIPTLSTWGMLLLTALLGFASLFARREGREG